MELLLVSLFMVSHGVKCKLRTNCMIMWLFMIAFCEFWNMKPLFALRKIACVASVIDIADLIAKL